MIDEPALRPDHVADGDNRKFQSVTAAGLRVDGKRSRGSFASADDVGTDHEKTIGIDGFARTDHEIPPPRSLVFSCMKSRYVRVSRKRVGDQHGVGAIPVQLAVGLIRQRHRAQGFPAFQFHFIRGAGESEISAVNQADGCRFHFWAYSVHILR
jgi:hypothetical protein